MSNTSLVLHSFPLSGHAHRIELALSLMGLTFENHVVDLGSGKHKEPEFLVLNPEGKVPVLQDGDQVVYDSTAILTYLAAKFDPDHKWIPADPFGQAEVHRYFAQSAGPLATGPARARLITVFNAPYDAEKTIADAEAYLAQLDSELEGKEWLVGHSVTFADVAIYSYVAHAPEGHVDLSGFSNIVAWLARIEALDGFVGMPKTAVSKAA